MSDYLPDAVRAQVEAANAIQSELTGGTKNPAEAARQEPATQQAQSEQQEHDKTRDASYWQHRFNVIQGKYNAELPPLRQQIHTLTAELEQLKVNGSAGSGNEKADAIANQLASELTEDELELVGSDLAGVISKLVESKTGHLASELEQMKAKEQQQNQDHMKALQKAFIDQVSAAVPNWQQLQSTPDGEQWLRSGNGRGGINNDDVVAAANNLDAETVIRLYQKMERDVGSGAVPPQQSQNPNIPQHKVQPQQSRATTAQSQNLQTWSTADIKQFYQDKMNGRYTPEEAAALERDIFDAQRQGRIIN